MTWDILNLSLVFAVQLGLLAGLFIFARRLLRSRKSLGSTAPVSVDTLGVMTIPVLATFTGVRRLSPWVAVATNSLNPYLAIASDRLEYRVIGRRTVHFGMIESVEVRRAPGTVNLCFVFSGGPFTFSANVGDDASASRLLGRLPRSITRGPNARTLEQLSRETPGGPERR